MRFLHSEFQLGSVDLVEVTLDAPANAFLVDEENFINYKNGKPYRYHGGHAETTPVRLSVPHSGKWYLVVDLGGFAGRVRAFARVIQGEGVLN